MADEPAEEEKPKSNKMIIIILIAVIILLIGGGAAFFMMSGGGDDKKDTSAEQTQKAGEDGAAPEPGAAGEGGAKEEAGGATAPAVKGLGSVVELDPFIVNLKSNGGPDRYLKAIIVLVLSNDPVKEEIGNRVPQIKDSVITVLSSKSAEEVLSIQGKFDLKVELIKRINAVISTGVVRELFFTEFVVQ